MLDVSFNLTAVVAMLIGIMANGNLTEVDSLNGFAIGPIP